MIAVSLLTRTLNVNHYNIHFNQKTNLYELWVTTVDGCNDMIKAHEKHDAIEEYKKAIDYAVEHGEYLVKL